MIEFMSATKLKKYFQSKKNSNNFDYSIIKF